MKKKTVPAELMWVFGELFLSLGVFFMNKANFGMSMIVANSNVLSINLPKHGITFLKLGTIEYLFQLIILIIFCIIMRKVKIRFLLSFITAFIYGEIINLYLYIFPNDVTTLYMRIVCLVLGVVVTAFGVACYFQTYLPLAVHELFVKDVSEKFNLSRDKFKICYDFSCLIIAVTSALMFHFFGGNAKLLDGIGIGTIVTVLFNGLLIAMMNKLLNKFFKFEPKIQKLYNFFK